MDYLNSYASTLLEQSRLYYPSLSTIARANNTTTTTTTTSYSALQDARRLPVSSPSSPLSPAAEDSLSSGRRTTSLVAASTPFFDLGLLRSLGREIPLDLSMKTVRQTPDSTADDDVVILEHRRTSAARHSTFPGMGPISKIAYHPYVPPTNGSTSQDSCLSDPFVPPASPAFSYEQWTSLLNGGGPPMAATNATTGVPGSNGSVPSSIFRCPQGGTSGNADAATAGTLMTPVHPALCGGLNGLCLDPQRCRTAAVAATTASMSNIPLAANLVSRFHPFMTPIPYSALMSTATYERHLASMIQGGPLPGGAGSAPPPTSSAADILQHRIADLRLPSSGGTPTTSSSSYSPPEPMKYHSSSLASHPDYLSSLALASSLGLPTYHQHPCSSVYPPTKDGPPCTCCLPKSFPPSCIWLPSPATRGFDGQPPPLPLFSAYHSATLPFPPPFSMLPPTPNIFSTGLLASKLDDKFDSLILSERPPSNVVTSKRSSGEGHKSDHKDKRHISSPLDLNDRVHKSFGGDKQNKLSSQSSRISNHSSKMTPSMQHHFSSSKCPSPPPPIPPVLPVAKHLFSAMESEKGLWVPHKSRDRSSSSSLPPTTSSVTMNGFSALSTKSAAKVFAPMVHISPSSPDCIKSSPPPSPQMDNDRNHLMMMTRPSVPEFFGGHYPYESFQLSHLNFQHYKMEEQQRTSVVKTADSVAVVPSPPASLSLPLPPPPTSSSSNVPRNSSDLGEPLASKRPRLIPPPFISPTNLIHYNFTPTSTGVKLDVIGKHPPLPPPAIVTSLHEQQQQPDRPTLASTKMDYKEGVTKDFAKIWDMKSSQCHPFQPVPPERGTSTGVVAPVLLKKNGTSDLPPSPVEGLSPTTAEQKAADGCYTVPGDGTRTPVGMSQASSAAGLTSSKLWDMNSSSSSSNNNNSSSNNHIDPDHQSSKKRKKESSSFRKIPHVHRSKQAKPLKRKLEDDMQNVSTGTALTVTTTAAEVPVTSVGQPLTLKDSAITEKLCDKVTGHNFLTDCKKEENVTDNSSSVTNTSASSDCHEPPINNNAGATKSLEDDEAHLTSFSKVTAEKELCISQPLPLPPPPPPVGITLVKSSQSGSNQYKSGFLTKSSSVTSPDAASAPPPPSSSSIPAPTTATREQSKFSNVGLNPPSKLQDTSTRSPAPVPHMTLSQSVSLERHFRQESGAGTGHSLLYKPNSVRPPRLTDGAAGSYRVVDDDKISSGSSSSSSSSNANKILATTKCAPPASPSLRLQCVKDESVGAGANFNSRIGMWWIDNMTKPSTVSTAANHSEAAATKTTSTTVAAEIKAGTVLPSNGRKKNAKRLAFNKALGETALHRAARLGYQDLVADCLAESTKNIDARDNAGYTALHECCLRGHLEVAKILLEHGADVSVSAAGGVRPIHDAVENDHIEVVRLLLSYGADPLITTYSGQSPLKLARFPMMKEFLKGYLSDISGESSDDVLPWQFHGSSSFMDPFLTGYDIFGDMPSDSDDDDGHLPNKTIGDVADNNAALVFEVSDKPHITTYLVSTSRGEGSGLSSFCFLSDVLRQTGMNRSAFLECYPDIQVDVISRQEFIAKAKSAQLMVDVNTTLKSCPYTPFIELVQWDDTLRDILDIEKVTIPLMEN